MYPWEIVHMTSDIWNELVMGSQSDLWLHSRILVFFSQRSHSIYPMGTEGMHWVIGFISCHVISTSGCQALFSYIRRLPHRVPYIPGSRWGYYLGVLCLFQQYFSHFEMMEGWTWKALCNEAPFRFGNNLASSEIRTRNPVIRSGERYPGHDLE